MTNSYRFYMTKLDGDTIEQEYFSRMQDIFLEFELVNGKVLLGYIQSWDDEYYSDAKLAE